MRRVTPEFTGDAHHGEVTQIGLEFKFMRRMESRQFQSIGMNMHMRRNVQAAGMSVQKRRQTLQECQDQKQAVISSVFSHERILTPEFHERQFFGSWQSRTKGVRMRPEASSRCATPHDTRHLAQTRHEAHLI